MDVKNEKRIKKINGFQYLDNKMIPCKISKSELASLYGTTVDTLRRDIQNNSVLFAELIEVGYEVNRNSFNAIELKIIFKYLGDIYE